MSQHHALFPVTVWSYRTHLSISCYLYIYCKHSLLSAIYICVFYSYVKTGHGAINIIYMYYRVEGFDIKDLSCSAIFKSFCMVDIREHFLIYDTWLTNSIVRPQLIRLAHLHVPRTCKQSMTQAWIWYQLTSLYYSQHTEEALVA